ncbi:hypothetical protein, partial [Streptomyces sp.]|uniref:hypothetical protein n=1 Tax=Streptomyces sp. TaxID=1931 RepID=UPI002810C1D2
MDTGVVPPADRWAVVAGGGSGQGAEPGRPPGRRPRVVPTEESDMTKSRRSSRTARVLLPGA